MAIEQNENEKKRRNKTKQNKTDEYISEKKDLSAIL